MSTYESESFITRDGQAVIIRSAVPDDVPAVIAYLPMVFAESPMIVSQPGDPIMSEEEERRWISEAISNDGALFLLAIHNGQIIGSCSFRNGTRRRERHQGKLGISIREAWRGRGVGKKLMESLLGWAASNPLIERVALSVFTDNTAAIRLYRSLGFVEEGVERRALKLGDGLYADTLLMARWVGQDVAALEPAPYRGP